MNATERRSVSRRTEDIYRKAIEDIRDYAIFMTDPDGVITNWNIGAQHILGFRRGRHRQERQQVFHAGGQSERCSPRRLLVVEDDSDTQELLKTVLEQHGAQVATVDSGARALEQIACAKPDVIISDIGMSGQNGYDLIQQIRSLKPEEGGHIPAIALTAYAGTSNRRRALLAGFQTHLPKPVEPDDLVAVILSLTFRQSTLTAAESR